ncbi:integrase [Halomonas ventosae]|uniref:Integrase n=1 Tax=Halomonas ventosae TaxID=229007 RepID=A0A4R6ZI93_9GAMM|nr:site-specific integrase [Halomonas ventosae]TDR52037.1 integrase [Halomonas ventosae]
MGKIVARKETGKLCFDFRYLGKRCREQTTLDDTPANRRKLMKIMEKIEAEITLDSFDYGRYFPNSPRAETLSKRALKRQGGYRETPLLGEFAETWFAEKEIEWRNSQIRTVRSSLDRHILPQLGEKEVGSITRADILEFRSSLAKVTSRSGKKLSASRLNHIMTPLRMMLNEAADRFEFSSPYRGIKSLRVPRTDVQPFTLEEVWRIIDNVRPDFRNYYTVRFFTGMRTGEIDGLPWANVDFSRRQILVKESLVHGEVVATKTDGSSRAIDMSEPVYQALRAQQQVTGDQRLVFCNRVGNALDHQNVTKRIWYPLLDALELSRRRPYQTRHTAATLWLAAGENPEWIARQMGHTTTEMLFRVYSRYVPNLTRQDGSAFEKMLRQQVPQSSQAPEDPETECVVAEEVSHAR